MSDYKYSYIPKEYFPAVMYACACIRKYGTFNVACRTAAEKYGIDEDVIRKYVRKRQGEGQKGKTRKYKYYLVSGWTDKRCIYGDFDEKMSVMEPDIWKKERKPVLVILKATNIKNAERQLPQPDFDRRGFLVGKCITNYEIVEFENENEAKTALERAQGNAVVNML